MAAELVRGDKGLLSQMTAGLFLFLETLSPSLRAKRAPLFRVGELDRFVASLLAMTRTEF
jgi:hypothetical protein